MLLNKIIPVYVLISLITNLKAVILMRFFYKSVLLVLLFPVCTKAQTPENPLSGHAAPVIFVGAGINDSQFTYQGSDPLSNAKTSNSISPQINIGTDVYFNKSQSVALRLQLGFSTGTKANLATTYNDNNSGNIDEPTLTTYSESLAFKMTTASFTPQILWNIYNAKKWKFFVDAGLAINYIAYSGKAYNLTTYYQTSGTQDVSERAFPNMHNIVFNVPLKLGVSIAHIVDIYADYAPKTALNQDGGSAINVSQYQFGVDYFGGDK